MTGVTRCDKRQTVVQQTRVCDLSSIDTKNKHSVVMVCKGNIT